MSKDDPAKRWTFSKYVGVRLKLLGFIIAAFNVGYPFYYQADSN